MPAAMYREPAAEVKVSGSAVIQDNGALVGAPTASNGNYLFSEKGAGVKPLVLLGSRQDILIFCGTHYTRMIENQISSLPDIHVSVQPYKPGARFQGLFPLQDTIKALAGGVAAFAPGSPLTDVAGGLKDLRDAGTLKVDATSSSKTPSAGSGLLYVRFHYLQDQHMEKIGTSSISLRAVGHVVRQAT